MGAHALISDRALVGMYYQRLEQGDFAWVDGVSMPIPSSQDEETHKWLGMSPTFREWLGGRDAKGFRDDGITITNRDFESTIEYHERDLAEDKTGQLQVRINEHADRAGSHDASLLSTLIINGESTVCYDGQYFFDTDHSEGDSGSLSNDISVDISALPVGTHGSVTAPSPSEMAACLLKGVEQMYSFKDDQGEPLNETAKKFLVQLPVSLWWPAAAAVSNASFAGSETNVIVNLDGFEFNLSPNPRLTWTDKFAMFRTDGSTKPFIRQEREPVTIDVLGQGSENFFNTRRVQVGLKKSGNVGDACRKWRPAHVPTYITPTAGLSSAGSWR